MNFVLRREVAIVIGGAIAESAFDAAAGQPHRESFLIMVTACTGT